MRKSYLFLLLSLYFIGCVPTSVLTDKEKEFVFSHEVNLKKNEIKMRLLQYANENFVSGKAVIQTNEDGMLSGNGETTVKEYKGLLGETQSIINMEFTFIVKYEDNKYKIKWIVKDMSTSKGSFSTDYWGFYKDEIDTSITKYDQNLYDYMKNKDLNF
ncbi:MAG: hypothetical protein HF314_12200 [Ignavibacteria bacterium]|jgi:hypothetical protein|nr:hypothetical protein [Ignavibacteria bacterium]MCU7503833.1 hypothetical protein [Ignavibacteria bacterium]MCU7517153.1 hypothetical protein [Ignavibacteria bacterium]